MQVTGLIENRYSRPKSLEALVAMDRSARWCLDAHRCMPLFQSVAPDGLSSICVYQVPDAQALRNAARQLEVDPPPAIWGATVHVAPGGTMRPLHQLGAGERSFALVDRVFDRPMDFEEVQAMEDEKSSCLTLHSVRFVCSFLSLDRLRMGCVYAAPDVESVRNAVRMTQLPFRSVSAAFAHS